MTDAQLYEELCRSITAERRALFDRIAPERTRHFTVVLEDIYQSHNASAVVRTCDLLGIQDLHVIENANPYSPSDEVTLGSSKWIDIHRHRGLTENTTTCLKQLRGSGYRIVVTSPHASGRSPMDIDISAPLAFCFGTELTGASSSLLEAADDHLRIPMYGFTQSYNISVSVAIVLFTVIERLRNSGVHWSLEEAQILALKLAWARNSVKGAEHIEARLRRELEHR